MRSHQVVLVDPRRGRRLVSGLVGTVVALALLVTFARLAPAAEASVQPSTMSLGGFTVTAPAPEDVRDGEDYTIELDLGDTSEIDMDAVREYLEDLDEHPRLSDAINDDLDTHASGQDLPRPDIPDFDGDITLDGSVLAITIDGDDVNTSSNWWQNLLAGAIGAAVGAVAVGSCAYLLEATGPTVIRRVCGFVGGFVSTLVINFILMAFDGKLADPNAWGNALAISLGVGLVAGMGDLIESATPAVIKGIKRALTALIDKIGSLARQAASLAGTVYSEVVQFLDDLFYAIRFRVGDIIDSIRARTLCEALDMDDLLGDRIPNDLRAAGNDVIGGMPEDLLVPDQRTRTWTDRNAAAHGEYIDGDGDGRPDFVDNDSDGLVSAGDDLVGDIITYLEGEPVYDLVGVTNVQKVG